MAIVNKIKISIIKISAIVLSLSFLNSCLPKDPNQQKVTIPAQVRPIEQLDPNAAAIMVSNHRLAGKEHLGAAYLNIRLNEAANIRCLNCDGRVHVRFQDNSKGMEYHYYSTVNWTLEEHQTYLCEIKLEISRLQSKKLETVDYGLYFCPISADRKTLDCDPSNIVKKCPLEGA